jgi:hypothetical protein
MDARKKARNLLDLHLDFADPDLARTAFTSRPRSNTTCGVAVHRLGPSDLKKLSSTMEAKTLHPTSRRDDSAQSQLPYGLKPDQRYAMGPMAPTGCWPHSFGFASHSSFCKTSYAADLYRLASVGKLNTERRK